MKDRDKKKKRSKNTDSWEELKAASAQQRAEQEYQEQQRQENKSRSKEQKNLWRANGKARAAQGSKQTRKQWTASSQILKKIRRFCSYLKQITAPFFSRNPLSITKTAKLFLSSPQSWVQVFSSLAHWALQLGSPGFRSLQRLLHPFALFQHYRHSYYRFHRLLFLRQCFYFMFSLSCFAAILFSIWLAISIPKWQQELQRNADKLFILLEEQYGVQIRFRLNGLYLLHQIELRDVQVRLRVPLEPLEEALARQEARDHKTPQGGQASIPLLPPLLKKQATPTQELPPSATSPSLARLTDPLPAQLTQALQEIGGLQNIWDLLQQKNREPASWSHATQYSAKTTTLANSQVDSPDTEVQLYVATDQLRLKFSLWTLIQQGGHLLWQEMLRQRKGHLAPPRLSIAQIKRIDGRAAWQLFQLLENIQELSFGRVRLQLRNEALKPSAILPNDKGSSKPPTRIKKLSSKFPFTWQEFLQTLRSFPIEIRSLELHFTFWQQIFEGQDIRFLLQPSLSSAEIPRTRQMGGLWGKLWIRLLRLFHTEPPNRLAAHTEISAPDSFLFDLQGKFHSYRSDAPLAGNQDWAFRGKLHASGALKKNFSQAYLILEMQELYSNYASLRPIQFKVEYRPAALKFQALSKIRSLDWKLQYLFQEQKFDLQLWAEGFRLQDYIVLNRENPRAAALARGLTPFMYAQLSGQSQVQINLSQKRSGSLATQGSAQDAGDPSLTAASQAPLQLQYQANIRAYLSGLSLQLQGHGDLKGIQLQNLQVSQSPTGDSSAQTSWQARFRGDFSYSNLFPDGSLQVDWQRLGIGYSGEFLLQRRQDAGNSADILVIETLHSLFSGPGIAEGKREASLPDSFWHGSKDLATQLRRNLAPWVQPQLRTLIFRRQNNYYISGQLLLPLSPQQLQDAETSLGSASGVPQLYKGKPLYAQKPLYRDSLPHLQASAPVTWLDEGKKPGLLPAETLPGLLLPADDAGRDLGRDLGKILDLGETAVGDRNDPGSDEGRTEGSTVDTGEPSFYLLPILSLQGSIKLNQGLNSLASPLELEFRTLQWDEELQSLRSGQVPLGVLLGRRLGLDSLFPGLDQSLLRLRSSLRSDFQNFQFWLEELEIQGENNRQNFLLQGAANAQQISIDKLQLRWEALKIDNRFAWDIATQQGQGLLSLQDQQLRYRLQQIKLPSTAAKISAGAWLLQGDHQLYAYFDQQRYQVTVHKLPLPLGFRQASTADSIRTVSNSLLSVELAGYYPQNPQILPDWRIDVSLFRLEIPGGGLYFPQGAELRFAGFWQPEQLYFQQLALLEPQRLLQGQGNLRFLYPLTPILPSPDITPTSPPASPNNPQGPSVYLPPSVLPAEPRSQAEGYWLGEFHFQGMPTDGAGASGNNFKKETVELNLHTEGQSFVSKIEGQFDATRFTQLIAFFQERQAKQAGRESPETKKQELNRGILQFQLQVEGSYRSPRFLRTQDEKEQPAYLKFQELQGNWQLAQANYAGRNLELGSRILWKQAASTPESEHISGASTWSSSWLFSEIQGHFGKLAVSRSFLSLNNSQTKQQLAGLLDYELKLSAEQSYRSSLVLKLQRNSQVSESFFALGFSPVEQELLRWRGSLHSAPLRSYSQGSGGQSASSIPENLRNLFAASGGGQRSSDIKVIYPRFKVFLQPRIVAQASANLNGIEPSGSDPGHIAEVDYQPAAELYLFRKNLEDFEMGIQEHSFWLNVGKAYPISFRAEGRSNGDTIDAQVDELLIQPQLLNLLIPEDVILKKPVIHLAKGSITGSLRMYGKLFDPAIDGSLLLQDILLHSPYFPDNPPQVNIELVSKGHIIMAKPFSIQFRNGHIYSAGYEEAYLRHQSLQITRYYLGFRAGGKEGIPIFYDAYGIEYAANTKGSATLEGNSQASHLNAELELNHLLMQGSQYYNVLEVSDKDPEQVAYAFSLNIRTKIGSSARLVYPQETSPIFTTQLNPRDELQVSYDGSSREGSITGQITLYDGNLYLLGNQMDLYKGELIFDETFTLFSPEINLFFSLDTYDIRGQGIQINMDYQGDLANLADQSWSPNIYSQPPLPKQQLRYLVAAQFTSGGEGNNSGPSQQQLFSGVLSQLGSSVVLKPAEELIRKGFKFDEVNLETDFLGNLLNDYLGINYRLSGATNGLDTPSSDNLDDQTGPTSENWLKYLDDTHISFGFYLDRNNSILLSFNVDLLYKPQDTSQVLFSYDGLQVVPGIGLKFQTPLLDITWDIGFAHANDFFITDSSLLLEWSLSDFLNRKRLAALERREKDISEELIPYAEE